MMRDIVISIAENKTRNIWTYDHIGPTSHPGSILTKHHPLVKSQGKPSLSRFYGSIAILSPSETVHACSQATRVVSMMGTLSSSRAEVFIIWSFANFLIFEIEWRLSDWSHTGPYFFPFFFLSLNLFPISQQKFYTKVGVTNLQSHDQYVEILLIYIEQMFSAGLDVLQFNAQKTAFLLQSFF